MASYKKLYEAAMEECRVLQGRIDEMTKLDSMLDRITDSDERQFAESFLDRCQNRAEVALLVRVLNKLGA